MGLLVADVLVETALRAGVKNVYGVMGDSLNPDHVRQCTLRPRCDDLFSSQWRFFVPLDGVVLPHAVGPRVGVSGPGGVATAFPWRYWLADSPSVSTYKPGHA